MKRCLFAFEKDEEIHYSLVEETSTGHNLIYEGGSKVEKTSHYSAMLPCYKEEISSLKWTWEFEDTVKFVTHKNRDTRFYKCVFEGEDLFRMRIDNNGNHISDWEAIDANNLPAWMRRMYDQWGWMLLPDDRDLPSGRVRLHFSTKRGDFVFDDQRSVNLIGRDNRSIPVKDIIPGDRINLDGEILNVTAIERNI